MDAASVLQADLETFLTDMVWTFSTHGGRSAAVVWPRGEDTVVPALAAAHGQDGDAPWHPALDFAERLGALVDHETRAAYHTVPAGDATEETPVAADTFLLPLLGAVEARLTPLGTDWPDGVGWLRHRLRAGEVLYLPAGFSRALSARSQALVLELTLSVR
ncbi:hypothetical protein NX794_06400 [Streptomyces sp. LP11]|uniref:JmjC domain-containing protein n=1 Tax=Streptomyces pyxinicus TaxID=2970331 RepID=A0ABT2AX92_9ACTN|nr:hypothetical protein [Streptomyces sp. LP11]MCS0600861.1 hypothetical protein [Streptomyces sp. LP11]